MTLYILVITRGIPCIVTTKGSSSSCCDPATSFLSLVGGVFFVSSVGRGGVFFVSSVGKGGVSFVSSVGRGGVSFVSSVGRGGVSFVSSVGGVS